MSATGKTNNYNLPLYGANDTTSYLVDFNGAMSTIDEVLHNVNELAETADNKANNLTENADLLNETITEMQTDLINVRNATTANLQSITLLQTHTNEQDDLIEKNTTDVKNLGENLTELQNEVNNKPFSNVGMYFENLSQGDIDTGAFSVTEFKCNWLSETYSEDAKDKGRRTLAIEMRGTKTDGASTPLQVTIPKDYLPYFTHNCIYNIKCNIFKVVANSVSSVMDVKTGFLVLNPNANRLMYISIDSDWSNTNDITITLEIVATGYDV